MFCERCGAQIPDGSAFCPNCGASVAPAAGAQTPRTTGYVNMGGAMPGNAAPGYGYQGGAYGAAAPAKKSKSKLPIILGLVAAVAVLAFFGVRLLSKPYLKPIDQFCKAFNERNATLLSECLSDELNSYGYYDTWTFSEDESDFSYETTYVNHPTGSDMSYYKSTYGIKDCYVVSVNINYYDSYYEEYDTIPVEFIVGKNNGKWKIYDFDSY